MRTSCFISVLLAALWVVPAMPADVCGSKLYDASTGIELKAGLDPAAFVLTNPIPLDLTEALQVKALADASVTAAMVDTIVTAVCWQSADDAANGKACADSDQLAKATPLPLSVGYCTEAGPPPIANVVFPTMQLDLKQLTTSQAFVIRYAPSAANETNTFLRVEWNVVKKKGATLNDAQTAALANPTPRHKTFRVTGRAGVARFDDDSRYKLWLYTGYTFRSSKNDFSDSYPELRFRAETRLIDGLVAMEQREPIRYAKMLETGKTCDENLICAGRARFPILRIYGEGGLTSVTVENNSSGQTTAATRSRQTFDGNFGFGYGWTLPVSTRTASDTNAFAAMFVARFGVTSIPGAAANPTADPPTLAGDTNIAFEDMFGIRFENETGHFEGAYFETGLGESEQYTGKKSPRWRVDGFLPMNQPGGLYRFAGRIQLDRHSPLSRIDNIPAVNKPSSADVRISLLFNIDLKVLANRLGVSQPNP
jgi:hypothetical protein